MGDHRAGVGQGVGRDVSLRHLARRHCAYLRVLDAFQPIWSAKIKNSELSHDDWYVLNPDELRTVLTAWPYPRE
jgi:hypothetical protein